MNETPLNTFAVVSFRLGNEATTVKYERYGYKDEAKPLSFGASIDDGSPKPRLVVESDSYGPYSKVYWIVFEDGHLEIETYLTTTLFEQIENPFARPIPVDVFR